MGKHTLITLSAKWYIFLCNSYLEGEGLALSFLVSGKAVGYHFLLWPRGDLFHMTAHSGPK